jgi:hypothetical protein
MSSLPAVVSAIGCGVASQQVVYFAGSSPGVAGADVWLPTLFSYGNGWACL